MTVNWMLLEFAGLGLVAFDTDYDRDTYFNVSAFNNYMIDR